MMGNNGSHSFRHRCVLIFNFTAYGDLFHLFLHMTIIGEMLHCDDI